MDFIRQKWLVAVCIAAGTLISSGAYAQLYGGVGVGYTKIDMPSINTAAVTGSATETKGTSWKAYGGYQFIRFLGIEAGYNDLGNKYAASFTNGGVPGSTQIKLHNAYLAGVATLPLGPFSLFAKAGMVRNSMSGGGGSACSGNTCILVGEDKNRTQPLLGVGAELAMGKTFALRLEYEDYGKTSSDDVWGTGSSGSITTKAAFLSLKASF